MAGLLSPPQAITWLLEVTNRLVGCRSLPALTDMAYEAIRKDLGYDRVAVILTDADNEWLSCSVGTDLEGRKTIAGDRMIPLDSESFYARMLKDRRMQVGAPGFLLLERAAAGPDEYGILEGHPRQRLLVALRTLDRVLGFIAADNLLTTRPIDVVNVPALVALANALAAMIENVDILESRAQGGTTLDADLRRLEHLSWLQEASARLATLQEPARVLDAIYASVRWGMCCERVALYLVKAGPGALTVAEVRGTNDQGEPYAGSYPCFGPVTAVQITDCYPGLRELVDGADHCFVLDRHPAGPDEPHGPPTPADRLLVALRHDDTLVGFLSVDNQLTGAPLRETEAAALVAFAAQAGLAIGRSTLWAEQQAQIERLSHRITELEWLRDLGQQVNRAVTCESLLDTAHAGIRAGLGYDRVGIWLSDASGTRVEELRGTDVAGRMTGHGAVLSLVGQPALDAVPGLLDLVHGRRDSYVLRPSDSTPRMPSLLPGAPVEKLVVALRSSEAVTGFIVVDNVISRRPITADHAGVLLSLASQLGIAIQRTRVHELQHAERLRLAVLVQTSHALNSTLDSDQILRDLAVRLVPALNAAYVVFSSVDAAEHTCAVVAQHAATNRKPLLLQGALAANDHYRRLERVITGQQPQWGSAEGDNLPDGDRSFLQRYGLSALLIAPVSLRGQALGVLEVYWDQHEAPSAETATLCSAIAGQVAIALGNAHLYADAARRAEIDHLTGLQNHRVLLQQLDRAVTDAASFALVLMDVDNFKLFNDTYGHLTGDAVLASVAATIRENCRDGDTAGRYGGDELALLLPSATRAEAEAVVMRLMGSIHSRPHLAWDGSLIPISLSPGIACFPEDGHTRRELVAAADAAMYEAKRCSSGVSAHGFGASRGPRLPGIALHDLGQMLGTASLEVLEGLVAAVDAKDRYTREHGDHVARLGLLLAETLDLPLDQRRAVTVAGLLHDVGKIGIPDRILRKPGTLTKDEYDQIKRHVPFSVAIVQGVISDRPIVEAIAFHHERWDGRGYPCGLAGEVTPLLGRIMQVADATSSMLLDRPYRKGMPWARVAAELRAGAGSQFDPDLVEVFIGSFERLSPASQAQREL